MKKSETELNRALRLISASNRTLLRANDETAILYDVCRIATEIGGYSISWVGFRDGGDETFSVRPVAHSGYDELFGDLFDMPSHTALHDCFAMNAAIDSGIPQFRQNILNDPELEEWHDTARRKNYQAAIALPLNVNGETIGALAIYAPEPYAFDDEEIRLLEELASDLSFGIQTIRLRQAHETANARIIKLAYFDTITGLPNRNRLSEILSDEINFAAADRNSTFALLMLDLDFIREINETYGHGTGDRILQEVSDRIRRELEESSLLTRFSGDDFIIIQRGSGSDMAAALAQRILSSIRRPLLLDSHSFSIGGSIGIAIYPTDAANPSDLLARADLAMSKVKRAGGGYRFYCNEMTQILARKLDILQRLKLSLEEGSFHLHYQPKVELYAGMIVGAEALIRWNDPVLGMVEPSEFIPIAESRGLMPEIGEWVLTTVCHHIKAWLSWGLSLHGKIAINVSGKQLEDPLFTEKIASIMEEAAVSPGLIELEITESCLMGDPELMLETVINLRSMGFSIAIDDFGTGYSSLAYLKKFPVNTLKIDQIFVKNMLHDRNDRAIISTIMAIAEQMGMLTVVEGIELEKQRSALQNLGCVLAQGYYFCAPESVECFTAKLLDPVSLLVQCGNV